MFIFKGAFATIGVVLTVLVLWVPLSASAEVVENLSVESQRAALTAGVRWNNKNWFTSPHPVPASLIRNENGEFAGTTTNGIPFTQTNVEAGQDVRVQMFTIQDHYHYIVEGNIVYADEDLDKRIAEIKEKNNSILVKVIRIFKNE